MHVLAKKIVKKNCIKYENKYIYNNWCNVTANWFINYEFFILFLLILSLISEIYRKNSTYIQVRCFFQLIDSAFYSINTTMYGIVLIFFVAYTAVTFWHVYILHIRIQIYSTKEQVSPEKNVPSYRLNKLKIKQYDACTTSILLNPTVIFL